MAKDSDEIDYDKQLEQEDELREDKELEERMMRDPAVQNSYGMTKFVVDPKAQKKFPDLFTKDTVLSNFEKPEIRDIKIQHDLFWALEDLSDQYPELEDNMRLCLSRCKSLETTSRAKGGFAAILLVKQILEHKKFSSDMTGQQKKNSFWEKFGFGKRRNNNSYQQGGSEYNG